MLCKEVEGSFSRETDAEPCGADTSAAFEAARAGPVFIPGAPSGSNPPEVATSRGLDLGQSDRGLLGWCGLRRSSQEISVFDRQNMSELLPIREREWPGLNRTAGSVVLKPT